MNTTYRETEGLNTKKQPSINTKKEACVSTSTVTAINNTRETLIHTKREQIRGYLAHKKPRPLRTLQQNYA